MTLFAIDLFAGPGGWDLAASRLGIDVIGIEIDDAACATRKAAGLNTIQGDVRLEVSGCADRMLIASPPCQTFSTAGKGKGRKSLDLILTAIQHYMEGQDPDLNLVAERSGDVRTALVLEPLRWIVDRLDSSVAMPYEYIALEQVPTVQPVWDAYAQALRGWGYSVDTGILHAEQYGVPQTRKRAILVAKWGGDVKLPEPTHRRYKKGVSQDEGDPSLKPWVSMAEALGWGMTARPSMTVTGGGTETGGAEPFGNAARQGMRREADAGRWAFAGAGATAQRTAGQIPRDLGEPAHTITGKGTATWLKGQEWAFEWPATTVVASFRPDINAAPGYRKAGDGPRQNAPGSIRVTVQEAGILQTFPADYPWQGTKTKQHQQVGNAIPPLLAEAILSALIAT